MKISKEEIMGRIRALISDEEMPRDYGFSDKKEILEMIKILSHDIRSPLITIAAGLKLLKKGAYGSVDKRVMDELEKLYEMTTKTAGNMEDFIERAFSLDGELDSAHEPLDIYDILDPVLIELNKEIRSGRVSLENGIALRGFHITVGNRFLLKAVFRNLIRNAIKYGGKGCEISMDIDEFGSLYKINVFNSGSSVPEEKRKMLFRKFCQINKRDNGNTEGMGLGLFLVREILERHGGRIWYKAEEDGSNFIFTLPKYEKQINLELFLKNRYIVNNSPVLDCPLSENLS